MSFKYAIVILASILLLHISESKVEDGVIVQLVSGTVNALNKTNAMVRSGFGAVVDVSFKPLEMIGTKAEESIIGITRNAGKLISLLSRLVKKAAMKFQTEEEKFIGCVKSEQFDPVKAIFKDVSSCVTGKADTVSNIVEKSLMQVNTTFVIIQSLTMLPTCQGAKCLADYTSGIMGKIGNILLGLASIGKDATMGIATIPVTLPVCLVTQPALSPVKIFGLLGMNILKCFQA